MQKIYLTAYTKKSQISSEKIHNILQHKKWVITLKIIYDTKFGIETSPFWELNCSLRQGTFFDAPCIAVEAWVCLNSVTTVFLLAKSSHFLLRITPAVRTRGSHFQFAFYWFAISQITKPDF